MKYKVITKEIITREYEVESESFRDAVTHIAEELKRDSIWSIDTRLFPINTFSLGQKVRLSHSKVPKKED